MARRKRRSGSRSRMLRKQDPKPTEQSPAGWPDRAEIVRQIREQASVKAKRRGAEAGYELLDWLEAEMELTSESFASPVD